MALAIPQQRTGLGANPARALAKRIGENAPVGPNHRDTPAQGTAQMVNTTSRLKDLQMMEARRWRGGRGVQQDHPRLTTEAVPRRRPRPKQAAAREAGGATRNPLMCPGELGLQNPSADGDSREVEKVLGGGRSHKLSRRGRKAQRGTRQGVR